MTVPLATPTLEIAKRGLSNVPDGKKPLGVNVASPMAGGTIQYIRSIPLLEKFLIPLDYRELMTNYRSVLHFARPSEVAKWVRNDVGDSELADRLDKIAANMPVYADAVIAMKELLQIRLAQYEEAITSEKAVDPQETLS